MTVVMLCAVRSTTCAGAPTAVISNGIWPGSCPGSLVGATCAAECYYGGSASVDCQPTGLWNTTVLGACAGKGIHLGS